MTNVRVVIADPRSERVPHGRAVNGHHLIVLADDTGRRVVPLWLRIRGAKGDRGRTVTFRGDVRTTSSHNLPDWALGPSAWPAGRAYLCVHDG